MNSIITGNEWNLPRFADNFYAQLLFLELQIHIFDGRRLKKPYGTRFHFTTFRGCSSSFYPPTPLNNLLIFQAPPLVYLQYEIAQKESSMISSILPKLFRNWTEMFFRTLIRAKFAGEGGGINFSSCSEEFSKRFNFAEIILLFFFARFNLSQ